MFLFKIYRPKLNWEQTKVFWGPCATFFCRKIDFFQKKLIFGAYIMKFDQISKLAKNSKNHDFWLFFGKPMFFFEKNRFFCKKKLIFCSIISFCSHSYVSYHILWLQIDTLLDFPKKSEKSWFFEFLANLDIWSNFMIYAPNISFFGKKAIFQPKKANFLFNYTILYS